MDCFQGGLIMLADFVIINDDSHTSLGYILLDDDNTQLSMYHLWGE
jgi:hypothetical protein